MTPSRDERQQMAAILRSFADRVERFWSPLALDMEHNAKFRDALLTGASALDAQDASPAQPALVHGYDATFWYDCYALVRDAVMEHLDPQDDEVAEEVILVEAIKRAAQSPAPSPIAVEQAKELGLNVDMLDVDRLRNWARLIGDGGHDITNWADSMFVAGKLRDIADRLAKEIADVGVLRAAIANHCVQCPQCQDVALRAVQSSAPAPSPAPEGWQPIETARRDQSRVLVGYYDAEGQWREHLAFWALPYEGAPMAECYWRTDGGGTLLSADVHRGGSAKKPIGATHWMDRPAAPRQPSPEERV